MSREPGIKRKRGWRKIAWLVSGVLFCFASAIVFFPNALLNQRVAVELTEYLVQRLGPEAICSEVELGWRHVTIKDILLPLDDNGTLLSISRIDATIDPLIALSQPGEYGRIIRSVNVVGPSLLLKLGKEDGERTAQKPFSNVMFETIAKIDSLRSFTFEGGKVKIAGIDTTLLMIQNIRGGFVAQDDGFNVSATGSGELPVDFGIRIDGRINPSRLSAELSANIDLNESSLALKGPPLDSIALQQGSAQVSVRLDSGVVGIEGRADLHEISLQLMGQSVYLPEARLQLNDGLLSWDSLFVQAVGASAISQGTLDLKDSFRLESSLSARVDLRPFLDSVFVAQSGYDGTVLAEAEITGTIHDPLLSARLSGANIGVHGAQLDALNARFSFANRRLEMLECSLTNQYVELSGSGDLETGDLSVVNFTGELRPKTIPKLLGQTSSVSSIEIAVAGKLESPSISWLARDSSMALLGNGSAFHLDGAWEFAFTNPNGISGELSVSNVNDQWVVSATNAHIVVPIVYPGTSQFLATVQQLKFDFTGDENTGESELSVSSDSLANTVMTRVLRQLEFDGNYQRDKNGALELNGIWYGTSGEGEEFFGQGKVRLLESLLTIDNLYVDEAGSLSGSIRSDTPWVDLSMSIEQLPLSRMPFVSRVADQWKLAGVVSGEVTARGHVDSVQWYADVSLVNGLAQGVPGYWGLLTAGGQNNRVESLYASFGRGVRSIFEANGNLDISENTVDIRAEFPASDCADFIQALSGRTGILSGDLDGEVLIFGKLSAPEIMASLRVGNGELLGELTVNRFALDATLTTEIDGTRMLAIPQLSFSKDGEYSFTGELSAEPKAGGDLRAYFEGNGDFLDLLQQVDADFVSLGSEAKLRVEAGGTWDHPQFIDGSLTVSNGKFTYPPAAPGTLLMNTTLQINSEGVVDSGRIQVNSEEDYIRLDFIDSEDPRSGLLTPLVIPGSSVNLGIMHISSSDNGIDVRLPGFMKPEWLGRITTGSNDLHGITISSFDSTRLRIGGDVLMRDARFSFPFISYGGGRMKPVTQWIVDRLYEAWWDLDISMGNGSHYDVEITGFKDSDFYSRLGNNFLIGTVAEYLDHISVDAIVSPTEVPLLMEGSIEDSSLRLYGKLGATSGKADYLDQTFWIEKLQAEFDDTDIFPIISGRSATYGVDSVGRTVPVYLTIYEIDDESNSRTPYGRFEDVTYVLEADGYPDQEQVLGLLGYDLTKFSQGKAEQLLTRTALTAAKRIWLDPISRKLERATFFDEISLAPGGGTSASIFRQQRETVLRDTLESSGVVKFLTGSNVTVGKYFSKDIFVTYTGELAEAAGEVAGGRLGLVHYWNLQYRVIPVSPDFVLDFAVEYDEASRRRDESVALKYSFLLEP